MPSEKKSKEDTWTPSELKKAMGKDTIRKEREERKKERLKEEQNGEEKHRRRRDEDGKNVHRSTLLRRKMKEDEPERYKEYLNKQREKSKKGRDTLKKKLAKKNPSIDSIEKKAHQLTQQRARQDRYLQNRKLNTLPAGVTTRKSQQTIKTRHTQQTQREYNKDRQKLCRSRMSSQKNNWRKKKDRESKQRKRMSEKEERKQKVTGMSEKEERKQKVTENNSSEHELIAELRKTPQGKSAVVKAARCLTKKGYTKNFLALQFQLNRRTLSRENIQKRRTYINIKKVRIFYTRPEIARVMPDKRYATKDGPGFLLLLSLKEVYNQYKNENPQERISFSTFAALRPRNVRLLKSSHREYCMCIYCMNIRNKLLCLEHARTGGPKSISEAKLFDMILCPKPSSQKFHHATCIESTCTKCKDYLSTLQTIYKGIPDDKRLLWDRWERVEKKVEVVPKTGFRKDLLHELVNTDIMKSSQGTTFIKHYHTAQWQQAQFSLIRENLPPNWILQVMDFAKNRSVCYQEEVKAAFFSNSQITLHPIVNYYHKPGIQGLIKEACIIISEDLVHDYHAVEYYKSVVDQHIRTQTETLPEKMVVYSDGCAAQYKSRGPFADLSLKNTPVSRNFYGSEHGKSACDAEIGVLNRAIDRAIIGKRVIINNTEDLFNYCQQKLVIDDMFTMRNFFQVKANEIPRDRQETIVKPVPNTRKIHNIENTNKPYQLKVRNLSCYCLECMKSSPETCLNKEYVLPYVTKRITLVQAEVSTKISKKHQPEITDIHNKENINPKSKNTKKTKTIVKKNTANQEISTPIEVIEEIVMTREEYFGSKLQQLQDCCNFEDLLALSTHYKTEFDTIGIKVDENVNIVENKLVIDKTAANLLPQNILVGPQLVNRYPVVVYGDGNCLPRSVSVIAFGNEDHFHEIRARIVVEMATNANSYLIQDSLLRGNNFDRKEASCILKTYTMFSEHFTPGDQLTENVIHRIYETEVMETCKNGQWMGIWELLAVSTILNCELLSVYLDNANSSAVPLAVLNRKILPLEKTVCEKTPKMGIMWSSLRNNQNIDHFVPLLPMEKAQEVQHALFEDTDFLEMSLDEDNSFIKRFLESDLILDMETSEIEDEVLPESEREVVSPPVNQTSEASNDSTEKSECSEHAYDENTYESSQLKEPVPGTNLAVKIGRSLYPAVVVEWPWVTFYLHKKGNLWTNGETRHTIVKDDIEKLLSSPDITLCGRNVYYTFPETRERRHHRDDDDRKRHKDKDRHHRNDDEERRRRKDKGSPDRTEMTEDDRERQRRERRERKEGKPKGDEDESKRRRPKEEDRDRERRHRDDEKERERRHKDEDRDKDRRRKDDERDRERRHKDERRGQRDEGDDGGERRKRRDDDGERRRHKEDDERERRKHHRDEDDRDKRKEKKDRDRHKESEEGSKRHHRHGDDEEDDRHIEFDEDERERQRRERREKREGKDKDNDKKRDDRGKSAKSRDVRLSSAVNGRSKVIVEKEEQEDNNDYDAYEDDFEDYEEDFEEDEEPEPKGKDDEMNQVLRALDEENDRLYSDSKRKDKYERSDSPDDRRRGYRDDSPEENDTRSRPKSSVINFLSAKRQVMTQQAYGKTSKRARDLLEMIELDTVTFDIMDLPPVKEYELYIRSYGRSDTRQAYVQTNDDAIEREIQTEEIDTRNKWTQHPAEDFDGWGRGDGEKDFEEEEKSQMNKHQDMGRLSKFLQQAGQVMSILLDEERSQDKTELSAKKSNISMSEGYTELNMLSILQGRHVEFAYFAPTQPNMLLTVYSKPEQSNPSNPTDGKGIICVWNTNEPSYPQRILACESQPRCCCFSPYRTSLAFAGMVDGSICAWDLRESSSQHRSLEFENTQHLIRFPTYNTAGVMESENHVSPVTTINPVITYVDETSGQETDATEDSSSGMSFQLVSSEDQGTINFWVVAELSNTDMAGSEIDLGLSPGGKIKVVISSSIKLEKLVREARSVGPVRSFEMQISPTDPNHFYIGTDGGYVIHGLRFGNRAFPRTFTTLSDSPIDVKSIDFSPFGHPCFLVATSEGCVHLFGTKTEKPLLSWPSKIWGTRNLKCVRWSRSRPCVFYVLDDHSQLYTFDILEGDAMPAKMETLSEELVTYLAFTSHIKVTGRHPQMIVCQKDGTAQIHTISKEYREQQTLENDFLPSYLEKF